MEKVKKFWNKLRYWQRGALIGLLFGLLFHIYIYLFKDSAYIFDIFKISTWMFHLVPLFLIIFLMPSNLLFEAKINVSNFITILIWYSLIGLIIGLIYGYIKNKKWSYTKKIIIFILSIILFAVLIIFLNFSLMVYIFSKIIT